MRCDGLRFELANDDPREQFPLLAEEGELWFVADELWAHDPEASEDEWPVRAKARGGLRVAVVLLVIAALVAYFVVPLGVPLVRAHDRSRRPSTGIQLIPVAPKQADTPNRPV